MYLWLWDGSGRAPFLATRRRILQTRGRAANYQVLDRARWWSFQKRPKGEPCVAWPVVMLGIVTWCGHACSEIALYPFLCIVSYLLETHGWCYSLCVRICMDYRELFHSIWGYQVSKTDYIVTKKKFIIVHRTSCSADPSCFADLCLALCAVTLKRGSAAPGREPFYNSTTSIEIFVKDQSINFMNKTYS